MTNTTNANGPTRAQGIRHTVRAAGGAALALALMAPAAAVAGAASRPAPPPPPKVIWCRVPGLGRIFTASTCSEFEQGDVQVLALRPGTPYGWTIGTATQPWVWPRYHGKPLKWPDKAPFRPQATLWYGLPFTSGPLPTTGITAQFLKVLRYAQTRPQPELFALLVGEMQIGYVKPRLAKSLVAAPGSGGLKYQLDGVLYNNLPVSWTLSHGAFLTYSINVISTSPTAPVPQIWSSGAPVNRNGTWLIGLRVFQADAPLRTSPKHNVITANGDVIATGDMVLGTGAAVLSLSVARIHGRWLVTKDAPPDWMGY